MKLIYFFQFLLAALILSPTLSTAADETIKIGVLLDTTNPLTVNYVDENHMKKVQGAALGGLIGGLIVGGAMKKRNSNYTKRFVTTLGENYNRRTILKTKLIDVFKKQNPKVELIF